MAKIYEDTGARLKELRKERGLTQDKMAEICKLTPEYYRNMENGYAVPSIEVIDNLHTYGWDIDYILIGCKIYKSAFSQFFDGISDVSRNNICNILIYKMKNEILTDEQKNDKTAFEPIISDSKSSFSTATDRTKEALFNEMGRVGIKNSDFAIALSVSEKTVSRWLDGESVLKTGMILSIYKKYKYSPSYILYGELNSNSKCDIYFRKLDKKKQDEIKEFAKQMTKFI